MHAQIELMDYTSYGHPFMTPADNSSLSKHPVATGHGLTAGFIHWMAILMKILGKMFSWRLDPGKTVVVPTTHLFASNNLTVPEFSEVNDT